MKPGDLVTVSSEERQRVLLYSAPCYTKGHGRIVGAASTEEIGLVIAVMSKDFLQPIGDLLITHDEAFVSFGCTMGWAFVECFDRVLQ